VKTGLPATRPKSVVSTFVRDGNGNVSVKTTDYVLDSSSNGNVLFGMTTTGTIDSSTGIIGTSNGTIGSIYTMNITSFGQPEIAMALTAIEAGLEAMTKAASQLGSISNRIELQENFVAALGDSIDSGVGRLVDADMEEESSRLTALQTQQQLAIQSLSIANSSAQNVLTLFRS